MCGIVGAVGLGVEPDPIVRQEVLGTLVHRGPDAGGSWFDDGIWLGFRRLSVIDLSDRSDQPMVDEATGVAIVFNGEIYNYIELRSELEARGAVFETRGDAEVLLRGYLHWGESVFERCNGMWAVGIVDPASRGVLLCRDRFGEKPLHYGRASDGAWWFASEPGTLRVAGVGTGRPDMTRVLGFLVLGDVEDPGGSFFEGISQLEPATMVRLTASGPTSRRRWWSLGDAVDEAWCGPALSDEENRDRLDSAVDLRLRSDVAVGTSLSGGVDSSTIVASLRAADPDRELHAFNASFPGSAVDEWDLASITARRFDLTLHRVEPTAEGFLADLDLLVAHQGGPIESPTVYAQWCVFREAHACGVTVMLDGQGADETWGGYPKYAGLGMLDLALSGRLTRARRTFELWGRLGARPALEIEQGLGLMVPSEIRARAVELLGAWRGRLLGSAFDGVVGRDPQGVVSGGLLRRAAEADLGRVLLPRLLRYADRNSMAFSTEVRLPFLDPAVMEAGLRSDWSAGIQQGWTKLALRRLASVRLPDEIIWRRDKVAYQTPDTEWLSRPDVVASVRDSTEHLHSSGILGGPAIGPFSPWRILSLHRFLIDYGLVP